MRVQVLVILASGLNCSLKLQFLGTFRVPKSYIDVELRFNSYNSRAACIVSELVRNNLWKF